MHLRHRLAANTSWCGRVITVMAMTDDIGEVTCRSCLRSYAKAGQPFQQAML